MKVSLNLAPLLAKHGDAGRGLVKRLADETKLPRQTISAMLRGEFKYVSLEAIGRVCDYLAEKHHLSPAALPGLLFHVQPEQFSAEVASRKHIEFVLGVRTIREGMFGRGRKKQPSGKAKATQRWVMASDSTLHGELFHELFGRGNQRWQTRPEVLEQRLVPAYAGPTSLAEVRLASEIVYDRFRAVSGPRACVSVGSMKSNGVSEIIMAQTFECSPFTPENDVSSPAERRCPVFIRFRDDDPQTPSCHGGLRLARRQRATRPGIYYETPGGKWEYCPVGDRCDAALVLYADHVLEGRTELIMAGFTGRATRCLGTNLHLLTDRFWPPVYQRAHLHLGLFLVTFQFGSDTAGGAASAAADLPEPTEIDVIPLEEEVLERRLG